MLHSLLFEFSRAHSSYSLPTPLAMGINIAGQRGKRVYQYPAFPLARLALLLLDCIFVSEGAGAFYPESG